MGRYFSDKTERGIDLVWMQFDKKKILEGRKLLEEAAEEGDADALCFLARTYMGRHYVWEYSGLEVDGDLAETQLRDSIKMGSACGVLIAMRCGVMTPQVRKAIPFASLKEAWDIVYKKADAGHPFCQYIIGNTYFWWDIFEIEGTRARDLYETKQDAAVAMARMAEAWFERAVANGFGEAVNNLYLLYDGESGFPEDQARQLEIAKRGAEAGFPKWMYQYGWTLNDTEHTEEARNYLLRAAEMGEASAWIPLAAQYYNGAGVPQDHARALAYYENSAREGDAFGKFMTAFLYYWGEGVPRDVGKSFYWAKEAVEGGEKRAYALAGHFLLRGEGVQKNEEEGIKLLFTAKELDDAAYEENGSGLLYGKDRGLLYGDLGDLYADGIGVEQDYEQAVQYYDKVAEWDDYAKAQRARFKKSFFSRKWSRR